jgi:hypothetical protein
MRLTRIVFVIASGIGKFNPWLTFLLILAPMESRAVLLEHPENYLHKDSFINVGYTRTQPPPMAAFYHSYGNKNHFTIFKKKKKKKEDY